MRGGGGWGEATRPRVEWARGREGGKKGRASHVLPAPSSDVPSSGGGAQSRRGGKNRALPELGVAKAVLSGQAAPTRHVGERAAVHASRAGGSRGLFPWGRLAKKTEKSLGVGAVEWAVDSLVANTSKSLWQVQRRTSQLQRAGSQCQCRSRQRLPLDGTHSACRPDSAAAQERGARGHQT